MVQLNKNICLSPNPWDLQYSLLWERYDQVKNLERRSLSKIIQVRYKCSHMYSYKKEAEGVLRQKRSREATEAKTGMMQSPTKERLDPLELESSQEGFFSRTFRGTRMVLIPELFALCLPELREKDICHFKPSILWS